MTVINFNRKSQELKAITKHLNQSIDNGNCDELIAIEFNGESAYSHFSSIENIPLMLGLLEMLKQDLLEQSKIDYE